MSINSLPHNHQASRGRMLVDLGDSTTQGPGIPVPYPQRVAQLLGSAYGTTNAGVGGYQVSQMRAAWTNQYWWVHYPFVSLFGGINDIIDGIAIATTEANLEFVWTDARAIGAKVIAMTVTPWKGNAFWTAPLQVITDTLNAWIRVRAAALGVTLIDLYALMGGGGGDPDVLLPAYDVGDHLHLSQVGHDFIASQLAPLIP